MNEREKRQLAFVCKMLHAMLSGCEISDSEHIALMNIWSELESNGAEVTDEEFRY